MNKANAGTATGIATRSSIGIAIGNSIDIGATEGGRETKATAEENTQRTEDTERGKEKKTRRETRGVDTLR